MRVYPRRSNGSYVSLLKTLKLGLSHTSALYHRSRDPHVSQHGAHWHARQKILARSYQGAAVFRSVGPSFAVSNTTVHLIGLLSLLEAWRSSPGEMTGRCHNPALSFPFCLSEITGNAPTYVATSLCRGARPELFHASYTSAVWTCPYQITQQPGTI